MLGTITTNYDLGLQLKQRIIDIGIVAHSEFISHIEGFHQLTFLYANDETKTKHKAEMKTRGYELVDAQDYMHVYYSFAIGENIEKQNENMRIPCQVYQKRLPISSSLS